jgi:NADPH:quinone reductase-like Zn-dependent oxidoreductase
MKAIVQDKYGSAEVLESRDIEKPEIGDIEVLVRVHAASIHVGDWILMSGTPYLMRMATGLRKPKNQVPGTDIAGTVEAVGKGVTQLRPGDEVFGWCTGAFAEYASASEDHCVPKPATLTFEQAAASSACPRPPRSSSCVMTDMSNPGRRSSSTARPEASARSPSRSPRRSAPR